MAHHNTWFGSSKVYIINSVGKLLDPWRAASNSTLQLACDKGVFSAHVYFAQSLSGHYPNGGRNAMVLATTSKTEGFLYWTCALPLVGRFVLAADSASQPLRRNQPTSQTATAAESASQPPCCGGISQPAKKSTSAQDHLMLVNSDHPCRPFLRGGWRNFACAADGGISHRSTAAGGISRSRSATEPRRLAEFRVCGGRRNQPPIRGGWRKSFLRPRCPTCIC